MSTVYDFEESAIYHDDPMDKPDTSPLRLLPALLILLVLDITPIALGINHYMNS